MKCKASWKTCYSEEEMLLCPACNEFQAEGVCQMVSQFMDIPSGTGDEDWEKLSVPVLSEDIWLVILQWLVSCTVLVPREGTSKPVSGPSLTHTRTHLNTISQPIFNLSVTVISSDTIKSD
ncbi:uncharacterized protein EI97DRAFT_137517, partial [Westerdykella ornata]